MDVTYCDTETTSLREPHLPTGRRVWEVALVRVPEDGSRPLAAWLQVTDVDLAHADPEALRIGKFNERFVLGCDDHAGCARGYGPLGRAVARPWGDPRPVELWGCTEANAGETIAQLTAGAVIAGSNPIFDMASFADLLRRHGQLGMAEEPRWYHHPRDVPNWASGWLRARAAVTGTDGSPAGDGWTGASYSTRVISEALGVPEPADRHSAWADVLWMMDLDAAIGGPSARLTPAPLATLGA